ncbi:MAG: hypothetical protein Hals2KO_06080 [Halioglobus sp.]
MLTLFVCQSVMAGVGEHIAVSFGDEVVGGFHLDTDNHAADGNSDPHQSGDPDLMDTNCCHAHGHCHAMAFVCQTANNAIPSKLGIDVSYTLSYHYHPINTLLRPPSIA